MLLLLAIVVAGQWQVGAYRGEFSMHSDEPAHVVTSLLVRDYLAQHLPAHPMRFAQQYYVHYPKVAIGHWPPFFYSCMGVWLWLFPPERATMMAGMALLAAALAGVFALWLGRSCGRGAALLAAVALVTCPLVRNGSSAVMVDLLLALLSLLAAWAYAGYLRSGDWRLSAAFGFLSGLSLLTKGNSVALALVPALALALTGRFDLVKRLSFWLPLGIVALMAGPWMLYTVGISVKTWNYSVGWEYTSRALVANSGFLANAGGPVVMGLALAGLGLLLRRAWREGGLDPTWASLLALLVAVFAFQAVVPVSLESRYLMAAAAPLYGMGLYGASFVFARAGLARRWQTAGAVLLLAVTVASYQAPKRKPTLGYFPLAQHLTRTTAGRSPVVLVSADSTGEGVMVSEIALLEPRPRLFVLRASKVLAQGDWQDRRYRLLFTGEQALRRLEKTGVSYVVLDGRERRPKPHGLQLSQLVAAYRDRFILDGEATRAAGGTGLSVYRMTGGLPAYERRISVDLRNLLGLQVEAQ